jgi:hypothetical protein
MTAINKKRKYEKPAMQVYELPNQPQILAGSVQASYGGYDTTIPSQTWE